MTYPREVAALRTQRGLVATAAPQSRARISTRGGDRSVENQKPRSWDARGAWAFETDPAVTLPPEHGEDVFARGNLGFNSNSMMTTDGGDRVTWNRYATLQHETSAEWETEVP